MNKTTTPAPAPVTDAHGVLQNIVESYYYGRKQYAQAEDRYAPDNAQRVYWRVRLGVLEEYGSMLAEALGEAEPDWESLSSLARP